MKDNIWREVTTTSTQVQVKGRVYLQRFDACLKARSQHFELHLYNKLSSAAGEKVNSAGVSFPCDKAPTTAVILRDTKK